MEKKDPLNSIDLAHLLAYFDFYNAKASPDSFHVHGVGMTFAANKHLGDGRNPFSIPPHQVQSIALGIEVTWANEKDEFSTAYHDVVDPTFVGHT